MAVNCKADEVKGVLNSYHIASDYQVHGSVYFLPLLNPSYVLKPLRIGTIRSYLTGSLLNWVGLSEIVPRLIQSESGCYFHWERGNRYLLTKIIRGRIADYTSTKDLKAAVITMANFHRICRAIIQSEPQRWAIIRFNPLYRWKKCLREMEICRERAIRSQEESFSRQYIQMWHLFYDMACQVLREFPDQEFSMQETICYHDWAFHNVIIHKEQAYLIDFDDMIVDHSIHDRVNLISRYLRLYHWSPAALVKALWLFDHFYNWKKGELKLLRLYLTFPFEYWMLGRQYYIEKRPWSQRYFQDQWQRKISFHSERLKTLDLINSME